MRFIISEFSSKQRLNYEDVASSVIQSKLSLFNCKFEQQSPPPLITPEVKFSRSSDVAEGPFAAGTQREHLDAVLSLLLCHSTSKTPPLYHYCQYSARIDVTS